jgi:hypothetical protein
MKLMYTILFITFMPIIIYSQSLGTWEFVQTLPGYVKDMGSHGPKDSWVWMQSNGDQSHYFYKSTDEGRSWDLKFNFNAFEFGEPYFLHAESIQSPDPYHYYVTFDVDDSQFLMSDDGGKTFKRFTIEEINKSIGLFMQNSNVGFISVIDSIVPIDEIPYILVYQSFFTTLDKWKKFEHREMPPPYNTRGGDILDTIPNGSIRLLQFQKWLVHYNIYENQWTEISEAEDNILHLSFVNENVGFGVSEKYFKGGNDAARDKIFRTTDGGLNFEVLVDTLITTNPSGLQMSAFYDENNGIAVGRQGKIWMTNNGGDYWHCWQCDGWPEVFRREPEDSAYGPAVLKVVWAGKTPIIGTRTGGHIYRYKGNFFKFVEDEDLKTILVRPFDKSNGQNINVEFEWSNISQKDVHIIQIARDSLFEDIVHEKSTTRNDMEINKLENYTQYYWRVATKFGLKKIWSSSFTFRTEMATPVQFSPECGADSIKKSTTLKWEEIPGAEYYRIRISEKSDFSDILESDEEFSIAEYILQNLEYEKTYYWQVQAYNSEETGEWSEICSFKVEKNPSSVSDKFPGLRIYPNPADDKIIIESSSIITKVELIDIPGISYVFEVNGANAEINISDYSPGVYFLKVELSGGIEFVEMVVVR